MTIPQLKQVKLALSKQGIKNIDDYISKTDENILLRMIGENTESSSETVTTSIMADNAEGASDMVGASDDDKPVLIPETSPDLPPVDGRRLPHPKATLASMEYRKKKRLENNKPPKLPVIESDSPEVAVPESMAQDIENIISGYCSKYNIDDLRKTTASVWRGACMAVGFHLKKSGALRDRQKEKQFGGTRYNAPLISALIPFWAYLCSLYDKPPLASDFISFTGVSASWFYNNNGQEGNLSSAGMCIHKKVLQLQESGLSSVLVDGRRNPTGTIFFLKNWHGWRDQREIVHTDGGSASAPVNYPSFDAICDKTGDSGGEI